ncbi:odorant receptor 131-2-like [Pangasianodon hypophthalmus]|uniref:odorant receptor 131-2-like n=1 Tax=Pangasianodon hypophthalmus TaxID=310915 RepID=UPI000F00F0C0|nr:odorant receptor 131-2-like [Pangasianodon hypophthalmus]
MNSSMNGVSRQESFEEVFSKIFVSVLLGFIIICINGSFVFTFFKSSVFHNNPRYILYIHLVINDMIMVGMSVALLVMVYTWRNVSISSCCVLVIIASATQKNTPLNLAAMAIERYIAICKPLHHSQICTVHKTFILIVFIWGVGLIPPLTDLVISAILFPLFIFNTVTVCSSSFLYNTVYHDQRKQATQAIYTSFVWLVLVYTYCRVLIAARKMASDKESIKKAKSTILLHGVQQLLCMLSFTPPVLDFVFVRIMPTQWTKISYYAYLITNIIPRLLSPLIYGIRDQTFVKHLNRNFSCRVFILKVESDKSAITK